MTDGSHGGESLDQAPVMVLGGVEEEGEGGAGDTHQEEQQDQSHSVHLVQD